MINLLGPGVGVTVTRDSYLVTRDLGLAQAFYDSPPMGQRLYRFTNSATGEHIVTEPFFCNPGSVTTVVLIGGIPSVQNKNVLAMVLFDN